MEGNDVRVSHSQGAGMYKRGKTVAKGQVTGYSATGKAILKTHNQSYYRGECLDNAYSGVGVLVEAKLPGGGESSVPLSVPPAGPVQHRGSFSQNDRHGFGETIFAEGKITSTWVNNSPGGFTIAESPGSTFEGLVQGLSAVGKLTSSAGKYHGQFKRGSRHGVGLWKAPKMYYLGEWVDDSPEGFGEEVRDDGAKVEGTWKNGALDGFGRITVNGPNSHSTPSLVFIGGFRSGEKEGFGRLEDTGTLYEGNWKNGMKHGLGFISLPASNVTYFGEWANDQRNGIGYSHSPGIKYIGEWSNDKPNGVGFLTAEGKREVLVSISMGVVSGQLGDDLISTYRNKFKVLKFDEFKLHSRDRVSTLQQEIEEPLEKVKRTFKNLHLDFTAEKEQCDKQLIRLDTTLQSVEIALRDIENFIDRRCTSSGVRPLIISPDLNVEDIIKVDRQERDDFKPSKSPSPGPIKTSYSPSPLLKSNPKPWVASTTSPAKQASKLTDFSKHFSKQSAVKKKHDDIERSTIEVPRRPKTEVENIKEQLKKQINKVEIKETEVAKEAIQIRKKENILKDIEQDLERREKELEMKLKQLAVDKLELDEQKQSAVLNQMSSSQENGSNSQNNEENIHTFEATQRQKEILKQLEGMVQIENKKLLDIKKQVKEENSKLSSKKEDNIKENAPKKTTPKTTQTDPIVLEPSPEPPKETPPTPEPAKIVVEPKSDPKPEPKVELSFTKLKSLDRLPSPSHVKPQVETIKEPVKEESIPKVETKESEAQTDPVQFKDPEPEEDQDDYFENLHRKTNMNMQKTILGFTLEEEQPKEDIEVYKLQIANLEEQKENALEEMKLMADKLKKTNDELEFTKKQNVVEKNDHIASKEELQKTKDELKKTKEELEAAKQPPVKTGNYVSVANSAVSDKKTEAPQAAKETVSLSPYQSNATLVRREQKSKEQEEALDDIEQATKRLEMKNAYLEEQLQKNKTKEQRLNKLVLDYTKSMNDWLNILQNPEKGTTSNPETLLQKVNEIDQGFNDTIPKAEASKTVTKPPSSNHI